MRHQGRCKGFPMRMLSLSGMVFGAILAGGLVVTDIGIAQPTTDRPSSTPVIPAPVVSVPVSGAATSKPVKPPAPSVGTSAKPSAPATASVDRKNERSFRHCKARAQKRGLRGAERRNFIRRCELGFAPPHFQQSNPASAPAKQP